MTPEEKQRMQILENLVGMLVKSDRYTFEKKLQILDGRNIQLGNTTGTMIGTASTEKLGFLGTAPVVRQTNGVDITNNVSVGGTDGTIAEITDLINYGPAASDIRNDIYQLARSVKIINDGLRDYGLFS